MKSVDVTKNSNIKCEHCERWNNHAKDRCGLTGDIKNYWNRCKLFVWKYKYFKREESK